MRSAFSSYTAVYFVRLRCENSTPKGIALQKIIILLCLCTADLSAEIESSDLRSNSLKAPPTPRYYYSYSTVFKFILPKSWTRSAWASGFLDINIERVRSAIQVQVEILRYSVTYYSYLKKNQNAPRPPEPYYYCCLSSCLVLTTAVKLLYTSCTCSLV